MQQEGTIFVVQGTSFVAEQIIGEGAYSIVHLCRPLRQSVEGGIPQRVAIKRTTAPEDHRERVALELDLARRLYHKNIVRCFCCESTPTRSRGLTTSLVMEYCPSTLVARMQHLKASRQYFSLSELCNILGSACAAIQYLHSQDPPIAHRDIKPENILMSASGVFKLCDLQSASTSAYLCRSTQEVGVASVDIEHNTTLIYRSPEMIDPWRKKRIDEKADVWALGVMLYYLMYFQFPFEETPLAILNSTVRFPSQPCYPPALQSAVAMCLVKNPDGRASIFDVVDFLLRPSLGLSFPVGVLEAGLPPSAPRPTQPLHPSCATTRVEAAPTKQQQTQSLSCAPSSGGDDGGADLFSMLQWTSAPSPSSAVNAEKNKSSSSAVVVRSSPTTTTPPPALHDDLLDIINPPPARLTVPSPSQEAQGGAPVDLFAQWGSASSPPTVSTASTPLLQQQHSLR